MKLKQVLRIRSLMLSPSLRISTSLLEFQLPSWVTTGAPGNNHCFHCLPTTHLQINSYENVLYNCQRSMAMICSFFTNFSKSRMHARLALALIIAPR